jgi:NADP-dependent 3-hydroxy acid dehydrogenase YdfG
MHTVFVTGCASGFGFHLARRLLALGHRVVATDPELGSWSADLDPPDPAHLLVLQLDVRHARQVAEAARRALAWAPVNVLVNNAGYAVFGTQEEADLESVRDLLDVNVLGVGRVTQALLPSIRANRGIIVQLSSVAGRTVFPESGWYAATKYAVEAMSEALYQETHNFGVRIRLIQPGSFATGFQARALAASLPRDPTSPYASQHRVWDDRKDAVLEPPQDPALVVEAIVASLADPAPFRRIPVGPDAARIVGLRDALGPDAWSRLAGDRAGADHPHEPGQVLHPAEVLALHGMEAEERRLRLRETVAARDHGHLSHWTDTPEGRAALDELETL